MIQAAFNSLISSNTLSLEEAKGQIRDSGEKEFKSKIQQKLPTPASVKSQLQSQTLLTTEDLYKIESKFNQLKNRCNFLKQQVDSKINQIESIKNKVSRIDNNFSKLDEVIEIGNDFIPLLKIIITSATTALGFFTGFLSNALAEKKLNDGLEIAKGKITEFNQIINALNTIKPYISEQTSDIINQVDPALDALMGLKRQIEQNCNYIDNIFLQKISQFSGLLNSDNENLPESPTPQFNNPEEILNNLENSNKDKFFIYLRDNRGNTGYQIAKR